MEARNDPKSPKSTIPIRIQRAPIADVVIVANALPVREMGMLVRAASSV